MTRKALIQRQSEVEFAIELDCEQTQRRPHLVFERPKQTKADSDEALIASWLGTFHPDDSARTLRHYRQVLGAFGMWLRARDLTLTKLTVEDLCSWRDELSCAASTQGNRLAVVKGLLSYAHRTGYLPYNIGAAVRGPKVDTGHDRALSEEEVASMLNLARRQFEEEEARTPRRPRRLRAARSRLCFLEFLYLSGLRVSEATAAAWSDLVRRPGNEYELHVLGKGRKRRCVLLPGKLVDELRVRLVANGSAKGRIFAFGARRAQQLVAALATEALGRPVSPHALRHAAASHAMANGAPVHIVRETLGHSSLATTGRYLHNTRKDGASRYLKAV